MDSKRLGQLIVGTCILLISLMVFFKIAYDKDQAESCERFCASAGIEHVAGVCPFEQDTLLDWIPLIASILIACIGGIGLYLCFSKKDRVIEQKEYDITSLHEDEKKLFLLIKENKEGVYQSELVKKSSQSKVKITRILDRLEQKGFIERKRRGMTNLIVLK